MARWLMLQWRKLERVLARVLVVSPARVVSNAWHIPSFNDSLVHPFIQQQPRLKIAVLLQSFA